MKILQVTNFFKPSWESGGPARVVYELSKKLIERGHEVTVYTTDGFKRRLNVEKNKPVNVDGIKTYYFRNLSSYLARERVFPTPYYAPIVARREITNFDVIHIHEGNTLGVIIHHYAKKYGVPYILQAHGNLVHKISRERSVIGRIWDKLFEYRTLRDASKIIALTKTEAQQYEKMSVNKNKIEIVPNGIDLSEYYNNLPEKGDFRKRYSIRDDEKIVLYMGRLNKTKGIPLLIKAFADISKELNNVRLVLVGPDDGYQSVLEEQVQELKVDNKVIFTGFVSNDEKMAAFVDADVFVTPSFSGFPVTFLEACACGTPIITTNNGDKLDWIHEKAGYVVEYDKDQLRDAIIKILSDEGLRRRFGDEGRRLIRVEFGWDKIVKRIERIYEQQ